VILDTDALSSIVSPRCPEQLSQKLATAKDDIFTTAINWAEICYGLARHPSGKRLRKRYQELVLPALTILPFDEECAEVYGHLRSGLEREGERLGEADLMISAIALRHGLVLVSGNVRHFSRVRGLKLVNWLEQ
jgi:tRNA(fMet)-specific endonuclease VapC